VHKLKACCFVETDERSESRPTALGERSFWLTSFIEQQDEGELGKDKRHELHETDVQHEGDESWSTQSTKEAVTEAVG